MIWGLQPTVANIRREHLDAPEFSEEVEYLRQAAAFFDRHRDFLQNGAMIAPGTLRASVVEATFLSRATFTPQGQERIRSKPMPALLHSAWRNPEGRVLLALANFTSQPQPFDWRNASHACRGGVPPRSFASYEPGPMIEIFY